MIVCEVESKLYMRSLCGRRVTMNTMRYTPGCCCSTQLDYKVHGSFKLIWSKVNPNVECRCCFIGTSVLLAAISTELQLTCWWGGKIVISHVLLSTSTQITNRCVLSLQTIAKCFMLACEVLVATCHSSTGVPKVSEAVRAISS